LGFKEKDLKVVVAEPSGTSRTLITELLRGAGFEDVTGVPSAKEGLAIMETETIGWFITNLMASEEINGAHILRICAEEPEVRGVVVTFILGNEELEYIPPSFQEGLTSFFLKPFTKDSLKDQLNKFLDCLQSNHWDIPLTAASYLRDYLTEKSDYKNLLVLEKSLLDFHQGSTEILLKCAIPQAKLGNLSEAKAILKQVKTIASSKSDEVAKIAEAILPEGESLFDEDSGEGSPTDNYFGIESVLVVDPDQESCLELEKILQDIGVNHVQACSSGKEAIKFLQENPEPDLVIQEWRIPELTGPVFLQRIRNQGARSCPIIILSLLIEKSDIPLLREMGVADVIDKPINKEEILEKIIWNYQQNKRPTDQMAMERKMREALRDRKAGKASEILARYKADPQISYGNKVLIEAEFAYFDKQYEEARDLAIEAIKYSGDTLFTMNLLGKTMINLRDFDMALKCFGKAKGLSPVNIERLCNIAEVHSETANREAADEALNAVNDIDADHPSAQESEVKVAVNLGDFDKAKELMGAIDGIQNVVSFMNNSAVAMVRCNMMDEGIGQYQKTLESLPNNRQDYQGIVYYNMGLAYIRGGNMLGSLDALKQASLLDSPRIVQKAKHLYETVNQAIAKNEILKISSKSELKKKKQLQNAAEDGGSETGLNRHVLTVVNSKAGDRALRLIFNLRKPNDSFQKLFKKLPHFKQREPINREATGGLDKTSAQ